MTYYINVKKGNIKEFLQIIFSLKSLGVIESFNSIKDLSDNWLDILAIIHAKRNPDSLSEVVK